MTVLKDTHTVSAAFFQPIARLAQQAPSARPCPELPDDSWIRLGLHRLMEQSGSGRGFLQEHGPRFDHTPKHSNYFASLQSSRRLAVLGEVNAALLETAGFDDRLGDMPELNDCEVFALDGHWRKAATHDPRHDRVKMAVGHTVTA